jgi:hypothetical protein
MAGQTEHAKRLIGAVQVLRKRLVRNSTLTTSRTETTSADRQMIKMRTTNLLKIAIESLLVLGFVMSGSI